MNTRAVSLTERVPTKFGNHYVSVDYQGGQIRGIKISSPGKITETAMEEILQAVETAVNAIILNLTHELPAVKS